VCAVIAEAHRTGKVEAPDSLRHAPVVETAQIIGRDECRRPDRRLGATLAASVSLVAVIAHPDPAAMLPATVVSPLERTRPPGHISIFAEIAALIQAVASEPRILVWRRSPW